MSACLIPTDTNHSLTCSLFLLLSCHPIHCMLPCIHHTYHRVSQPAKSVKSVNQVDGSERGHSRDCSLTAWLPVCSCKECSQASPLSSMDRPTKTDRPTNKQTNKQTMVPTMHFQIHSFIDLLAVGWLMVCVNAVRAFCLSFKPFYSLSDSLTWLRQRNSWATAVMPPA